MLNYKQILKSFKKVEAKPCPMRERFIEAVSSFVKNEIVLKEDGNCNIYAVFPWEELYTAVFDPESGIVQDWMRPKTYMEYLLGLANVDGQSPYIEFLREFFKSIGEDDSLHERLEGKYIMLMKHVGDLESYKVDKHVVRLLNDFGYIVLMWGSVRKIYKKDSMDFVWDMSLSTEKPWTVEYIVKLIKARYLEEGRKRGERELQEKLRSILGCRDTRYDMAIEIPSLGETQK